MEVYIVMGVDEFRTNGSINSVNDIQTYCFGAYKDFEKAKKIVLKDTKWWIDYMNKHHFMFKDVNVKLSDALDSPICTYDSPLCILFEYHCVTIETSCRKWFFIKRVNLE